MNKLYLIGFFLIFGSIGACESGSIPLAQCMIQSGAGFLLWSVPWVIKKVKGPVKAATLARRFVPTLRNDYINILL